MTGCIPYSLSDVPLGDLDSLLLPYCEAPPVPVDRAPLVALYESTSGKDWYWNQHWLTDAPIGDWEGVTTDSNGRVTSILLPSNNLKGQIPPEIGDLSHLKSLILFQNYLSGEIPSELGSLENLESLWLEYNELTGCIPLKLHDIPDNDLDTLGLPPCQ